MRKILTIKAYNRPHYFEQVISKLVQCPGLNKYITLISIDYIKERLPMLRIIEKYKLFDKTQLIMHIHRKNIGCAGNMKFCIEEAFEKLNADYMIHLEDDTVPSTDYIYFMDQAYDIIKNKPNVFAVCPYRRKRFLGSKKKQIESIISHLKYIKHFECAGGYGITKDIYNRIIKAKGGVFGTNGNLGTKEAARGEEWKREAQMNLFGSWAWPFERYFRGDLYCLYPEINRVENIGENGLNLRGEKGTQLFKEHIYVGYTSDNSKQETLKLKYIEVNNAD